MLSETRVQAYATPVWASAVQSCVPAPRRQFRLNALGKNWTLRFFFGIMVASHGTLFHQTLETFRAAHGQGSQ